MPIKLRNAAVISLLDINILSVNNKTLKVGKIHLYNVIHACKIAEAPNSSSSSVDKPISQTAQVFNCIIYVLAFIEYQ